MSVLLPTFRRVRLTQQCVIHPQDKGGNYLPCASEDWVLFVSLAADGEQIILRTEHRCLPIKPGSALLPPNVCHELPFVQAPCLMLEFSAADDGQAMFEFPQLQGTPAWMLLLLLYSEQTTAAARTPLLDALLMQMASMAHGFELCAPDAAFSLATEVLQHLNLCFADELAHPADDAGLAQGTGNDHHGRNQDHSGVGEAGECAFGIQSACKGQDDHAGHTGDAVGDLVDHQRNGHKDHDRQCDDQFEA